MMAAHRTVCKVVDGIYAYGANGDQTMAMCEKLRERHNREEVDEVRARCASETTNVETRPSVSEIRWKVFTIVMELSYLL